MKKKIFYIFLLFLCTLPMVSTYASYFMELNRGVSTTGARPAVTIETISTEAYFTRGTTTTYQFRVKNSDADGQGEVKLLYALEFQMPVTTGVTYSLKKGSTAIPMTASGTTADGRPLYKTAEQTLPAAAQTDTYTLTMVNSATRAIAVLDKISITAHVRQAQS